MIDKPQFKIMVVDDARLSLAIVKHLLDEEKILDLECFYFIDSKEAKAIFLALQPDLLITDIFMPDVDGFELISYVKQQTSTPILAISSEKFGVGSSAPILQMAKSRGADHTLSKSDLRNELLPLIESIFI